MDEYGYRDARKPTSEDSFIQMKFEIKLADRSNNMQL